MRMPKFIVDRQQVNDGGEKVAKSGNEDSEIELHLTLGDIGTKASIRTTLGGMERGQ